MQTRWWAYKQPKHVRQEHPEANVTEATDQATNTSSSASDQVVAVDMIGTDMKIEEEEHEETKRGGREFVAGLSGGADVPQNNDGKYPVKVLIGSASLQIC